MKKSRGRGLLKQVEIAHKIVRRFALGFVRANKANGSVKTRRKTASWSPDFLL
jgi:hypothetical protein